MRNVPAAILIFAIATGSAFGTEAPKLPASAKKLSAAQIVRLYDGNTFTFTSYTSFGVATGTVTYDFNTSSSHGSYKLGWHQGKIDGHIHMDGDKFCYKVSMDREHCDFMYRVGASIYDVDPDGSVQSVNRQQ